MGPLHGSRKAVQHTTRQISKWAKWGGQQRIVNGSLCTVPPERRPVHGFHTVRERALRPFSDYKKIWRNWGVFIKTIYIDTMTTLTNTKSRNNMTIGPSSPMQQHEIWLRPVTSCETRLRPLHNFYTQKQKQKAQFEIFLPCRSMTAMQRLAIAM